MGLFTSNCPQCDATIDWFIKAPKDYVCACGRAVSEDEIETSWSKNYAESRIELVRRMLTNKYATELPEFEEHIANLRKEENSDSAVSLYCNTLIHRKLYKKDQSHVR